VPGGEAFPLGPGDVVLVSRGAGGAGLALAQVLACCGTPIAVVGRGGPGEDSEVVKRLDQLRLAGARVAYELIDVSDPAGLTAATARIERKLGPVTAIGHTAADGRNRLVSELTEAEIRAHVAAGAAGLRNLVGSVKTGRLRLIATFGSVIGRYGMAGESLLALSSGSLAGQAQRLANAIPGCRAMHVDWPGWSESVLGVRADLAAGLARAGIRPIGVEEGSRLLLKMLATPVLPARITAHGRVGLQPPAAIAGGGPQLAAGARGRFLQFLRVHYPGVELVSEARLALSTDPYLAEHRVDGIPVLPAVMALEAMAQAASALAGRPVRAATGV
jgi:enediyne polyketide synthase